MSDKVQAFIILFLYTAVVFFLGAATNLGNVSLEYNYCNKAAEAKK